MDVATFIDHLHRIKNRIPLHQTENRSGIHFSRRMLLDMETADRRPYIPGDDLRFFDWKYYLRSQKAFVRQSFTPSSGNLFLFVDLSPSMFFHREKIETAIYLALAIGYLHLEDGDRVFLAFSQQPPIRFVDKPNYLLFFEHLVNRLSPVAVSHREDAIEPLLEGLVAKSTVVLISDLFFSLQKLEHALREITGKGLSFMIWHIFIEDELLPPQKAKKKNLYLIDYENKERFPLSAPTHSFWNQSLLKAHAMRDAMAKQYGGQWIPIDAKKDIWEILTAWL